MTSDKVYGSVKKMKSGKATDPTRITSELLIAGSEICLKVVADHINLIIRSGSHCHFSYSYGFYGGFLTTDVFYGYFC